MDKQSDNPGVRFPPPVLHAAAVVGGYLLNRRWPLPIGSGLLWHLAAWLFVALYIALALGSIGLFWRRHTSIIPNRPATTLVIAGPYRFTRNPMYIGIALLTLALAIFLDTWWPIILLVPVQAILQTVVIAREEEYLRRRFGAEYDAYTRQVRRWI
jgi:protein-S-isoprenylcysteine O-methyltransferase Ste14